MRPPRPRAGEIDDISDIFDVQPWVDGQPVVLGALTVEPPRLVCHPTESYGMRFTDRDGVTFAYSGDTGICDAVVELARGGGRLPVRGILDPRSGPPAEVAPVRDRSRPDRGPRRRG